MAIFGAGNRAVGTGQIREFLANPNLTSQDIFDEVNRTGVSLDQIRAAVPGDARFSDENALPFLASRGITPPSAPVGGGIPTGLAGSESALQGALSGSLDAVQAGLAGSIGHRDAGRAAALAAAQRGIDTGRADIDAGISQIGGVIDQGVSALQPFVDAGRPAFDLQAALSGALGPDAQRQAFADFQSSPGQEFLRDRGEQAITRNAAATGGLGGGNVLRELQRQGIGFAAQDFGNAFDRLGILSGAGFGAAQNQASLRGQQAGSISGLTGQKAGLGADLGRIGADINFRSGEASAADTFNAGNTAGQLAFNTGQALSSGRTNAGNRIADANLGVGDRLAGINQAEGRGVANVFDTTGGNVANLLVGAGTGSSNFLQQLQQLLAGVSQNQGAQVAGLSGVPQPAFNPGILGNIGAAASGIGTAIAASDRRLKENIRPVGRTPGGNTLYTWAWNSMARSLGLGDNPTLGVIAQEVMGVNPSAVYQTNKGWLVVDYSKVY